MWGTLSEVGQTIVLKTGTTLDVVDVGWPSAAAIAFGSRVGTLIIPVALAVNIVCSRSLRCPDAVHGRLDGEIHPEFL